MDGRFFDDRRIAKGYAKDRPFLHTQVIDMVKKECIGSRIFQNGLDVGCGAGFPGMPLAIARPSLEVTLLDSQRKRIDFLEEARELYAIERLWSDGQKVDIEPYLLKKEEG